MMVWYTRKMGEMANKNEFEKNMNEIPLFVSRSFN